MSTAGRHVSGARPEAGFALLAVLWLSAMLSIMALGYASTARLKAEQGRNALALIERDYLLDSGLARGWHEYRKYRANQRLLDRKEELEGITGVNLELWYPRFEPFRTEVDGTPLAVSLVNAAGRRNVNLLRVPDIEEICVACGLEPEAAGDIADAILDWIDSDDNHRLNGAENDYYLALPVPYYCKNAPLDSIEELLLVKGVTPELYFGTAEHPGLVDFLTTVGESRIMDLNSASPRAFILAGEMPEDFTAELVARRDARPIGGIGELTDVIPQANLGVFRKYFGVVTPEYVLIEAALVAADGTVGRAAGRTYEVKKTTTKKTTTKSANDNTN